MTQLMLKSNSSKEVIPLINEALENEKRIITTGIRRTERLLSDFENRYEMNSNEFFEKYQLGKLGDASEMIDWAGEYKILMKLKREYQQLREVQICT
ncbi:MAG: hypothetical protein ABIF11_04870 [Nitrospirota bacterium]